MGQSKTAGFAPQQDYAETLTQRFRAPAGKNPMLQRFDTHIGQDITPEAWLQSALAVGEALGIEDLPFSRSREDDSITYKFHFNDVAQLAQLSIALNGIVAKKEGYTVPVALSPNESDTKLMIYATAIMNFCNDRNIPVKFKEETDRMLFASFRRNIDYYAVRQAMLPGGEITRMVATIEAQGAAHGHYMKFQHRLDEGNQRKWPYHGPAPLLITYNKDN